MSVWTETHVWIVECFDDGWKRARFNYGRLDSRRGTPTPKMTLSQAMGNLRMWKAETYPLRMRHVQTQDVILADILD